MKTEIILAALRTILTNVLFSSWMKAAAVLMFATTDAQTATESQFYGYFCGFFSSLVMIVNLKLNAYLWIANENWNIGQITGYSFIFIFLYYLFLMKWNKLAGKAASNFKYNVCQWVIHQPIKTIGGRDSLRIISSFILAFSQFFTDDLRQD